MSYLFGDGDPAARRLALLASLFSASSRAFLCEAAAGAPALSYDLGCGPGYSTHLVTEVLGGARIVGLDNSAPFLALARSAASETVSFRLHDVAAVPFPEGPADLLYCRLLLTHLAEPGSVVARWASQLRPGGLLLIEETEWVRTHHPTFRSYLSIVEAMLAQHSNQLYIGPALDRLGTDAGLGLCASAVRHVPVADGDAALMFLLNLHSWRSQPFIREHYPPALIGELEVALRALAESRASEEPIVWGIRQVVLRRP